MIVTTKMRQVMALVMEKDREAVTRELLKQGVLDFINLRTMPEDWSTTVAPVQGSVGEDQAEVRELRSRIETFFQLIRKHPAEISEPEGEEDFLTERSRVKQRLDSLAGEIQRVREEQKRVHRELMKLQEISRHIPDAADTKSRTDKMTHQYVVVRYGSVPEASLRLFEASLKEYPAVFLQVQGSRVLMTMKRDDDAINALLEQFGWIPGPPPAEKGDSEAESPDAGELKKREAELVGKKEALEKKAADIVRNNENDLYRYWSSLRVEELSQRIENHFGRTERTCFFTGWLPADKRPELEEGLNRVTQGRCVLEWNDPMDRESGEVPDEVPVVMSNPAWLRPFEDLVKNYAVPAYGTVDPTLFVAFFYLAMFGLMFGDAGHGAVVFLAGWVAKRISRKKGKEKSLFSLMQWCGAAAAVSGIVFGSYFGMPLLPPLWFDYHAAVVGHGGGKTIMDILVITIYFGIVVIGLGLLLNWYNRLVKKDWIGLLIDKGGLLGGWMYGAGTWTAFYFARSGFIELPSGTFLALAFGLPALLMIAKPISEHRHHGGAGGLMGIMNVFMEWVVELLEVFSGYLSNTLSFMRVAGLGIAHVSLMTAFFQIAALTAPEGGVSIAGVLILVLGNALVIALEGLSAGIQSLRLNYYEFFSKYFDGTGRAYAPITLRSGNSPESAQK